MTAPHQLKAEGKCMSASTVNVVLLCEDGRAEGSRGSISKKLPRSSKILALKMLCKRLFGIELEEQILRVSEPGDANNRDISQDEQRSLADNDVRVRRMRMFFLHQPGIDCWKMSPVLLSFL